MCFTSLSKQRKLSTHLSEDWKVEWALCFLLTRWDQQKFTLGLLSEISLKKQRNIKHHIGTLHRHKYQLTRAYGDDTFSCKGSPKQVEPHVWFCTCFYAECPSWSNNLIYPGFGLVQYQEYVSLCLLLVSNQGSFACKTNVYFCTSVYRKSISFTDYKWGIDSSDRLLVTYS